MSLDRNRVVRLGSVGGKGGGLKGQDVVAQPRDDVSVALLDRSKVEGENRDLPAERVETAPAWPKSPSYPAVEDAEFATLPRPGGSGWIGSFLLFIVMVLVPLGGLLFYFLTIATPQYFAEFRFSVTEVQQANGGMGGNSLGSSAAAALAGSVGGGASSLLGGSMQNFVVVDYLKSRQAVDELDSKVDLRKAYGATYIDWWSRLRSSASPEQLVRYWNGMFTANYDPLTGIATAEIKAYSAKDALKIAQTLVAQAENLVNDIAQRAQLDSVRFAQAEVERAQAHLKDVRQQLAEFREQQGTIDPTQSVVPTNTQLSTSLRDSLSQSLTQLGAIQKQKLDSSAPQLVVLRNKIAATIDQLNRIEQEVGGKRDGKSILAGVVARFEALSLDRQYAETILLNDLQALDRARANAAAQHLYLTPHVRPSMPGSPGGPDIAKSMLVAGLGLVALWFLTLLGFRSVRQHVA